MKLIMIVMGLCLAVSAAQAQTSTPAPVIETYKIGRAHV